MISFAFVCLELLERGAEGAAMKVAKIAKIAPIIVRNRGSISRLHKSLWGSVARFFVIPLASHVFSDNDSLAPIKIRRWRSPAFRFPVKIARETHPAPSPLMSVRDTSRGRCRSVAARDAPRPTTSLRSRLAFCLDLNFAASF